jgi:hypothetical protein
MLLVPAPPSGAGRPPPTRSPPSATSRKKRREEQRSFNFFSKEICWCNRFGTNIGSNIICKQNLVQLFSKGWFNFFFYEKMLV